jgi:hypothetical protein
MMPRFAIPFAILALLFLPLPFVVSVFVFSAVLAMRPRGEPGLEPDVLARPFGPTLLRGPPR